MTTFGFSAFLKIVNSSARTQQSLLRQRILQTKKGGYDFHKEMRTICGSYLSGRATLDDCLMRAGSIVQEHERKSALLAIQRLVEWRDDHRGSLFPIEDRTIESPRKVFKVRFDASFGYAIGEERIAMHLWNTMAPKLDSRLTRASLSLFAESYADYGPLDLGVLSLRSLDLIRLADRTDVAVIGRNVLVALEDLILGFGSGGRPRHSAEDRPSPDA